MPLRTILFSIVASSLAAVAAQAQSIVPVSMSTQADAFARLDWTSPLTPDSIDTDSVSGTGIGSIIATAQPSNQGITSVFARGSGGGSINFNGDGYRLIAFGALEGHSNLAAITDALFSATTTLVFDLDQAVDISLECAFPNSPIGLFADGEVGTSLTGPGGASIFSFIRPLSTPGTLEFTELISLAPGQYTLSATAFGSGVFPAGLTNFINAPGSIIDIHIVPAPGGVTLLAFFWLTGSRRRLCRN